MFCFIIIDYSKILKRALRLFIPVISVSVVSPTALLSQPPDLGTANNFAVFTSVGNVTNTIATPTSITGNVGTDDATGVIINYLPLAIVGSEEINNATTDQVSTDVMALFTDLIGRGPATAHIVTYGLPGGETFLAGVYDHTGAGGITGKVILDANDIPNAIFIFQSPGAFSVSAGAEVELINGAEACNVFWVGSTLAAGAAAMSIGANATMKGTLITRNGAVSIGDGAELEGRMLTVAGAATTNNSVISLPACAALPIELISFKGNRSGEGNTVLKWSTASEINNDFFTIERSPDAVNWEVVGAVDGAGNSTEQINYEFTDFSYLNKATYYRLKQTDFDKNFKYEAKIYIEKHKDPDQLFIHIDPLNNYLNIVNKEGMEDIKAIHIYNVYGNQIYHSTINQSRIDISNFKNGSYVISIYLKSEIRTLKFIVYKN
jgi:hypothetical protein